jgi:glyoxylase-like metal-dependent hydrolase (beta-lactamase superfamily II)
MRTHSRRFLIQPGLRWPKGSTGWIAAIRWPTMSRYRENIGRDIEFSSRCWLIKHKNDWLLWDTGVAEATLKEPRGWSTLPKLIVYHLDKSVTGQLAQIGLRPDDIGRVAISHTHGDHIGNVALFPNSTIVMQRAEYRRRGSHAAFPWLGYCRKQHPETSTFPT